MTEGIHFGGFSTDKYTLALDPVLFIIHQTNLVIIEKLKDRQLPVFSTVEISNFFREKKVSQLFLLTKTSSIGIHASLSNKIINKILKIRNVLFIHNQLQKCMIFTVESQQRKTRAYSAI